MFLLQSLSFKSQNCEVYFSNTFTVETRLSTSPIFVIIYFQILCTNTDLAKKHINNYTRYGINFMVTPKALCLLLGPNECRDSTVLITGQFFNPWNTLLLQLSKHQCCMISAFVSLIFTYFL